MKTTSQTLPIYDFRRRRSLQYQLRQVLRLAMPALRPVLRVALLVITDKDLLDLPATMGTIVRLQQFPEVHTAVGTV